MYNNPTIIEKEITLSDIPCILIRPESTPSLYPTIFYYHGWTSNPQNHRFKAYVLASFGFQVLIPTAIHHSVRGNEAELEFESLRQYFSDTVLTTLKEYSILKENMLYLYDADPEQLIVMGHSMGAMISQRIFQDDLELRTAVIFDGCGNWNALNEYAHSLGYEKDVYSKELLERDPISDLEKIRNRPLLIIHGQDDKLLPIGYQDQFVKSAIEKGQDQDLVYVRLEKVNHTITAEGLELACEWCENYRCFDNDEDEE